MRFENLPPYGPDGYATAALEWVMERLPRKPYVVWTDGDEILCEDEAVAECIADLVDALFGDHSFSHTGYYDPKKDERENAVDDHTGYWYVDFD